MVRIFLLPFPFEWFPVALITLSDLIRNAESQNGDFLFLPISWECFLIRGIDLKRIQLRNIRLLISANETANDTTPHHLPGDQFEFPFNTGDALARKFLPDEWSRLNLPAVLASEKNSGSLVLNFSSIPSLKINFDELGWTRNQQTFNLTLDDQCRFSFTLKSICFKNWYTRRCNVHCAPHLPFYSCSQRGEKICREGWKGENCTTDINECSESKGWCKNGGKCTNIDGSYRCSCFNNTNGKNCEFKLEDRVVCTGAKGRNRSCSCRPGWEGHFCKDDVNECSSKRPCKNNANCSNVFGSYKCSCKRGFEGPNCETDIDECKTRAPCLNGATCKNFFGTYACRCPRLYVGSHCQRYIACNHDAPCYNGGTCIWEKGHYVCKCSASYNGSHCHTLTIDQTCDPNSPVCNIDRGAPTETFPTIIIIFLVTAAFLVGMITFITLFLRKSSKSPKPENDPEKNEKD